MISFVRVYTGICTGYFIDGVARSEEEFWAAVREAERDGMRRVNTGRTYCGKTGLPRHDSFTMLDIMNVACGRPVLPLWELK